MILLGASAMALVRGEILKRTEDLFWANKWASTGAGCDRMGWEATFDLCQPEPNSL